MKISINILTYIFAVFWIIFGLNGFLHFFPIPAPPADSAYFMEALEKSGYVMPLTYGLEVVGGILLLLPKFRSLGLILLAPVTLNIILYDLFLNPGGLTIGMIIGVIHALLLWDRRNIFCPLICNKV